MGYDLKDRILGSMYAAGIGDAIGVHSEATAARKSSRHSDTRSTSSMTRATIFTV